MNISKTILFSIILTFGCSYAQDIPFTSKIIEIKTDSNAVFIGIEAKSIDKIAVEDLNDDNFKDLIFSGSSLTIYLNNQNGGFKEPVNIDSARLYQTLNINSDNLLDLFTSKGIFINNNEGNFIKFDFDNSSPHKGTPLVADIDNDGDDDLIGISKDNKYIFYKNNGKKMLPDTLPFTIPKKGSINHFVLDYDDDGDIDIVTTWYWNRYPDKSPLVLLNNGQGKFEILETPSVSIDRLVSSNFEDINGDGKLDFTTYRKSHLKSKQFQYQLNLGNGRYTEKRSLDLEEVDDFTVESIDINGDGLYDLFIKTYSKKKGSSFRVLYGEKSLNFSTIQKINPSSKLGLKLYSGASITNFNDDNKLDFYYEEHKSFFDKNLRIETYIKDQLILQRFNLKTNKILAIEDLDNNGLSDFIILGSVESGGNDVFGIFILSQVTKDRFELLKNPNQKLNDVKNPVFIDLNSDGFLDFIYLNSLNQVRSMIYLSETNEYSEKDFGLNSLFFSIYPKVIPINLNNDSSIDLLSVDASTCLFETLLNNGEDYYSRQHGGLNQITDSLSF